MLQELQKDAILEYEIDITSYNQIEQASDRQHDKHRGGSKSVSCCEVQREDRGDARSAASNSACVGWFKEQIVPSGLSENEKVFGMDRLIVCFLLELVSCRARC